MDILYSVKFYYSLLRTTPQSVYQSVSLSLFLSLSLSLSLSLCLCVSVCLSPFLSLYISIYLSIYQSIYLYLFLFVSLYMSLYLCVCLSQTPPPPLIPILSPNTIIHCRQFDSPRNATSACTCTENDKGISATSTCKHSKFTSNGRCHFSPFY